MENVNSNNKLVFKSHKMDQNVWLVKMDILLINFINVKE